MNRLLELMKKDGTHERDNERKALFHIMASNEELFKLQNSIYDFQDHSIKPEILESGICTSSKNLITIGFNLYNGYPTDSFLSCFSGLDAKNFETVIEALRIRTGNVR